jgi:pilus assembly protein CpaF
MRADALVEVRRGLHEQLLRRVDARGLEEVSRTERRLRVREEALAILREERHILPRGVLTKVINEVSDAVVGLGPIEFLLKDPEVTEVMVNGPDDVYVERKGRLEKVTDGLFEGEEAVLHVIERIVAPLGLRFDGPSTEANARLPDGSGCRQVCPPCRKHDPPTASEYASGSGPLPVELLEGGRGRGAVAT